MSTVEPTSQSSSFSPWDGPIARLKSAPPKVLIAITVVLILAGYLIYREIKSKSSSSSTNSWASAAKTSLNNQGYQPEISSEAIDAYANGQSLNPAQISLVATAIGSVGTPDGFTGNATSQAAVDSTPSSGPHALGGGTGGVGSGTNTSATTTPVTTSGTATTAQTASVFTTPPAQATPPASADGAATSAFWYVPVLTAGYSTTFEGIAQQFGTTPQAVAAANPSIDQTIYGKLPMGSTIKVPR